MPTPSWLGATPGQPGLAGQVNQFLGAHAISYVYAGAIVAQQTTAGAGSQQTNAQYLAQQITTGAGTTSLGRVMIRLKVTGTPQPVTVSLYADSGGPTGRPLVSTVLPKEFVSGTSAFISVPLPVTVTPSTAYWIVLAPAGDPSDCYTWSESNQVSGAMTSPDGVTWTAQAYGFEFQVFDATATTGILTHIWEDAGARWTYLGYWNTGQTGQVAAVREFTTGQTTTGYTVSTRIASAGPTLTGVT